MVWGPRFLRSRVFYVHTVQPAQPGARVDAPLPSSPRARFMALALDPASGEWFLLVEMVFRSQGQGAFFVCSLLSGRHRSQASV